MPGPGTGAGMSAVDELARNNEADAGRLREVAAAR
jgi:hypothetical protein